MVPLFSRVAWNFNMMVQGSKSMKAETVRPYFHHLSLVKVSYKAIPDWRGWKGRVVCLYREGKNGGAAGASLKITTVHPLATILVPPIYKIYSPCTLKVLSRYCICLPSVLYLLYQVQVWIKHLRYCFSGVATWEQPHSIHFSRTDTPSQKPHGHSQSERVSGKQEKQDTKLKFFSGLLH